MASVDWSTLTRMPVKVDLYRDEIYFREAYRDVEEALGGRGTKVLHSTALLMVRPEGLVAGKLGVVCDFLEEHELVPVAVRSIQFDRLLIREMWRYQHTQASLDRLAVNDRVLLGGPALVLFLRSDGENPVPATVRLSGLKGPATEQVPGTLRSVIGQPNRLCSLIHCADEPADLVRELGLLLDEPDRLDVLRALAGGRLPDRDAQLLADARRREAQGGRSLDHLAALRRVSEVVARIRATEGPLARHAALVAERLDDIRQLRKVRWRDLEPHFDALGSRLDYWDVTLIGCTSIEYDEPGASKMIGSPDRESWHDHTAQRHRTPAELSG